MNKKNPVNNSDGLAKPTDIPKSNETTGTNTQGTDLPNNTDKIAPGGIIQVINLSIESITLKTDDTSMIRLKINEPQSVFGENIKYIETEVYNAKLEGLLVGDNVSTYVNFNYDTLEWNGEVCRITGPDLMRSLKK